MKKSTNDACLLAFSGLEIAVRLCYGRIQSIGEDHHHSLYKPASDDFIKLLRAVVFMSEGPCYGTRVRWMLGDCVYIHTECMALWCVCLCKWYVRFLPEQAAIH